MNDTEFTYDTTLNGGIVTVVIDISMPSYMERLSGVFFEDVEITRFLDKPTLTGLEMEAENAYSNESFDNANEFNPAKDAFKLGE